MKQLVPKREVGLFLGMDIYFCEVTCINSPILQVFPLLVRHNCGYIRRIIVVQSMYSLPGLCITLPPVWHQPEWTHDHHLGLPNKEPLLCLFNSFCYVPFHCLVLLQPGSESPCLSNICNSKGKKILIRVRKNGIKSIYQSSSPVSTHLQ